MQIVYKQKFSLSLDAILDYIAIDSLSRAKSFNMQLEKVIDNISHMPYKYRKSFYYDDEDVRDMIFKGYTVSYRIDKANNQILVLNIFKWIDK